MNSLYEVDFFAWTQEQVEHLKKKEFDMIDLEHLLEEIDGLSGSDKSSLKNHLANAMMHMLKIKYQPMLHSKSWDNSIACSVNQVQDLLEENPSFKRLIPSYLTKAYRLSVLHAIGETGLERSNFPKECPWTFEEIMEAGK